MYRILSIKRRRRKNAVSKLPGAFNREKTVVKIFARDLAGVRKSRVDCNQTVAEIVSVLCFGERVLYFPTSRPFFLFQ